MLNYDKFPTHVVGGVRRYIEHAIPPGSFLTAVICNDLKEACGRADDENQRNLCEIVKWFYNEAPHDCWGSEDAMRTWRGLNSQDAA